MNLDIIVYDESSHHHHHQTTAATTMNRIAPKEEDERRTMITPSRKSMSYQDMEAILLQCNEYSNDNRINGYRYENKNGEHDVMCQKLERFSSINLNKIRSSNVVNRRTTQNTSFDMTIP